MSAQIDSKPQQIIPANQPLIFTISDTGTAPDRFVVQVFEDSTEIAKFYLTPNTNDVVHFDLSEAMRDRVSVDDKVRNESSTIHDLILKPFTTGRNGLKQYEVRVGTYTGTTETLNQDNASVYLVDGAEQILDGLHPNFKEFYPTSTTSTSWLTDRVKDLNIIEVKALDSDLGVAAFLNDSSIISGSATKVAYEIYKGSSLLASQDFILNASNGAQAPSASDINQKITYMGIFPQNVSTYVTSGSRPTDFPDWTHYHLTLESISSLTRSSILKVIKSCAPAKHEAAQLAWTNTRGGWDYLQFLGRTPKTIKSTSKMYRKTLGDWDASTYTFIKQARESQPYQVTANATYNLNNVNFGTAELQLIENLIKSDNVMLRIGNKGVWMPVNLDTKSYKVEEAISKLFNVSLSVTLAQTIKC